MLPSMYVSRNSRASIGTIGMVLIRLHHVYDSEFLEIIEGARVNIIATNG